MKIFHLPDLGEGLAEAEIRQWHVHEGDWVETDQLMVSMETAKAVVDIPAPRTGKILKLYGKVGDIISTAAPLVEFEEGDQETATVVGHLLTEDTVLVESPTGISPTHTTQTSMKILPAVRALAKQLNVDLAQVTPTGTNQQITAEDVKRTAQKSSIITEPLRGMRRAMALNMTQAHGEVVPVSLIDDADIQHWPADADITVRLIQAIAAAIVVESALNVWFDSKKLERKLISNINIGIALDTEEGLFVPVIKNVSNRSASELREILNRFKSSLKTRTLPAEDLQGSTIMLSNFGMIAGRYANPIIIPPNVAIVGVGQIRDRIVAIDGKPTVHRLLPISLTIDHRAVTGGEAARFLRAFIDYLEKL